MTIMFPLTILTTPCLLPLVYVIQNYSLVYYTDYGSPLCDEVCIADFPGNEYDPGPAAPDATADGQYAEKKCRS